ncbi:alpha/beta hydrolase [Prosthecobacter sp.]|uniref:alpha/beta hydrolase n=1 Tax=Prosthecobacter sp. TaxID=1965333 RepID=UPI003784ACE7
MKSAHSVLTSLLLGSLAVLNAAEPTPLKPTFADVPYGTHVKQKVDFYQAKSDKPTPVVFFIHGGGWLNGDKNGFNGQRPYLDAGISVVSIGYRLLPEAAADGLVPPVQGPLLDAARALQLVRSKAAEWNIDKARIGATGSSAGSCSALWLAFHPDMADAQSADPVARESTRLWCVAVIRAQTSLDPQQMREWIPNNNYGAHAFGFKGEGGNNESAYAEFLAKRESILPWIAEYSPYALLTADDPPVYLLYNTPPAMGQPQESTAHSANFGVGLQNQCRKLSVPCELVYPGAPEVKHADVAAYLIERLKAPKAR